MKFSIESVKEVGSMMASCEFRLHGTISHPRPMVRCHNKPPSQALVNRDYVLSESIPQMKQVVLDSIPSILGVDSRSICRGCWITYRNSAVAIAMYPEGCIYM